MAWTATITNTYRNPVPSDSIFVDVSFSDGKTTIVKTGLKLPAAQFQTQDQVQAYLTEQAVMVGQNQSLLDTLPNVSVTAVPQRVTMFQCRAVLQQMNLLTQVDQAVQAAGGVNSLAWEYSTYVDRGSPLVASMAAQLGLTAEQTDQMFIQASQIAV